MSNRSASRSTILPFPSSPHWAPMTAITISGRKSEIGAQKSEIENSRFQIPNTRSRLDTKQARLRSQKTKPRPTKTKNDSNKNRSGRGRCANMLDQHAGTCGLRGRADDAFLVLTARNQHQG